LTLYAGRNCNAILANALKLGASSWKQYQKIATGVCTLLAPPQGFYAIYRLPSIHILWTKQDNNAKSYSAVNYVISNVGIQKFNPHQLEGRGKFYLIYPSSQWHIRTVRWCICCTENPLWRSETRICDWNFARNSSRFIKLYRNNIVFSCGFQQFWWQDTTSYITQHWQWWDINNSRWRPNNR